MLSTLTWRRRMQFAEHWIQQLTNNTSLESDIWSWKHFLIPCTEPSTENNRHTCDKKKCIWIDASSYAEQATNTNILLLPPFGNTWCLFSENEGAYISSSIYQLNLYTIHLCPKESRHVLYVYRPLNCCAKLYSADVVLCNETQRRNIPTS